MNRKHFVLLLNFATRGKNLADLNEVVTATWTKNETIAKQLGRAVYMKVAPFFEILYQC